MRITGISTHVVGTPWRNLTYVQVHTDEGLTGVGETRMLGHTDALLGYLHEAQTNHILGSDPFAVEDLVKRMKYGDYGRAGEIVMSGIAVIEMACWDIKGKALGVPVWQLLGGKVTDKVKAYANGWYTTERTPEAYHKAAQGVMERGYKALKIDPFGTGHFELDHAAEPVRGLPDRGRARRHRAGLRADAGDARPLLARHRRPPRQGPGALQARVAGGAVPAGEPEGAGEGRRQGRHPGRHG